MFFIVELTTMLLSLRKRKLKIICLYAFEETHCINNFITLFKIRKM